MQQIHAPISLISTCKSASAWSRFPRQRKLEIAELRDSNELFDTTPIVIRREQRDAKGRFSDLEVMILVRHFETQRWNVMQSRWWRYALKCLAQMTISISENHPPVYHCSQTKHFWRSAKIFYSVKFKVILIFILHYRRLGLKTDQCCDILMGFLFTLANAFPNSFSFLNLRIYYSYGNSWQKKRITLVSTHMPSCDR